MTTPETGSAADSEAAPPAVPRPPTRLRRAAGIYGTIVTASVLATAGTHLRTLPLAASVFVTVLVYWLAEEYAEIGEHASAGHLPTWAHVQTALGEKWPMVSASFIPLAALLGARAVGASASNAALVGLTAAVVLLVVYGWTAGRAAGLHGLAQVGMTVAAGSLGGLMIVLKIVLVHLH